MELKEKAIKELDELNTSKLLVLYDIIISMKSSKKTVNKKTKSSSYLKVREILENINGSLSEDIISMRRDRI